MGMLSEFREFAVKGSAIDMAVGIVIGGAFGKIVASLVNNVIMPPVGLLLSPVDFSDQVISLGGSATIKYGLFINEVISFVIVAFCIFLVVRQMNRIKRHMLPQESTSEPTTKTCPQCLSAIPIKAKRCAHCTSQLEG